MSNPNEELPELLAKLSAWRTISQNDNLGEAPAHIQQMYERASILLSNLQEGDEDPWLGGKISFIVRKSTKFIVYLDEALEIRWWWVLRVNESVVTTVQARVNALKHESSFLLTQPIRTIWLKSSKSSDAAQRQIARNIRSLIGEAMAVALNVGTQEDCEQVLAEAQRQIAVIKDQQARPVFTLWFIASVVFFGLLAWAFYGLGKGWACLDDWLFVRSWLEAGWAGAFGALISAITRTRSLQLEPSAGHRGLRIEAWARALIGFGAGLLVFFALRAGVLQAALSSDPEIQRGMQLFLCVAAGASERILPSLIGRAEGIVDGVSERRATKVSTGGGTASEPAGKQTPTAKRADDDEAVG